MSDNIPFEIQLEIIKKVSDVKSLVQFRSVSKPWKYFIDSFEFIKGYGARDTQPHSYMLMYEAHDPVYNGLKYVSLVEEDDNETLKVQQQEFAPFVVSPLLKQYCVAFLVGFCHGLVCFYCYNLENFRKMLLIWNPSIQKSFGILVPRYERENEIQAVYGFGVCPVTSDPTVVKVVWVFNKPWHVEVFTLSLGVWNVIPSGNLPRQSIRLNGSAQAVIDRFIYWGASEQTIDHDGNYTRSNIVVSFDLNTKEFKVVDLPENLTNGSLSLSKLRESLVVSRYNETEGACGVWVMEHDSSFTKLFSFGTLFCKILGFRKNGETILETRKEQNLSGTLDVYYPLRTLDVYDPCSQQTKNLGISGAPCSFFVDSYKQSLLLLDQPELRIYSKDN